MKFFAIISVIFLIDYFPQVCCVKSRTHHRQTRDSYFSKYLRGNPENYPLDNLYSESFSLSEEDLINEIRNPLERRSTDDIFPRVRHRHGQRRLVERDAQNEHQPRFQHSAYSRRLDENIEIGTSVLTVEATDEDLNQYGAIQYEIPDSDDFTIDEGGVIYTARRLDFESTGGTYRFHVVARNPIANDEGTRVPITIKITDKPDAPVFDSSRYYFNISEFSTRDNYVGTVVARDSDNDLEFYSLQDVEPSDAFVINRENGIILVGNDKVDGYVINFKAVATDKSGAFATVPVVVNVIDENTNKPIFENCSGYNNFPVLENQTVPQDILLVKATDDDHGQNGVVEYYLLTEGPEFAIDRVSGQLSIQQPLDRDNGQKEQFITVIAKDLAEDPLQGSCSFTIVVEDINDNPPIFDQESYSRAIPSDTQENAPILRLTATDNDAGKNAEVRYSLDGSGDDLEYFLIDQNSGVISLKKPLTQSMVGEREFHLTAQASDVGEIGQLPLSSSTEVVFSVGSPGTMAPSVDKQMPERASVSEDATLNTNIVSICARSNSASNDVYMDMINGNVPEKNSEGTFDIRTASAEETGCPAGTTGGNIYLSTLNLDFEEIQAYALIIQLANDNGRAEYPLTVTVTDVNDNPPVLQQPYTGSISENVADTIVMVVQAVDKDSSPEFRELTYSFKDPPAHVRDNFRIDAATGEIWNIQRLDREKEKQYRIPVQVTDGVNERDRQYWIIVNDQNDEPPKFNLETGVYETEVEEDLTIGKDTGIRLVVEDQDILNEFSYQIISGNEASKFHINSKTGVISVNKELDYDAPVNDRNFTMEVRVSDGLRYDTTVVKISVINVNDKAPMFLQSEYSASVLENEECDKIIVTVSAYDPDYPNTGDIIYSLSRAEQSNFTIDAKEGNIKVKGCLDRESATRGTMNIFPIAFDEGGEGKNSEPTSIKIIIQDVNDNHPYIQSPPDKYAQFMENVAPQNISNVVVIRLNDYDDPAEGNGCPCKLAFDQSTPTNVFESFDVVELEDENQYQLVTKKTLDREAQKFYDIPFLTTDSKGFSGIRTLTVEVGDQNDSPMSDGESKILVYNYMSSFPSIVIGSVYVTDADDYDVDDKTFEFDPTTPSEDQQFFDINFNNGNITMKRGTGSGDYTLVVQVTDNVRKEKAKGTIHISVIDLPKEAVMESGSFLIQDRSVGEVISQQNPNVFEGTSLYDRLRDELGSIFDVPSQNVDIFHLVEIERTEFKGVEVRFNVHGSPYYTSSHVNGILMQHKNEIESNLEIRIPVIDDNMCLYEDSLRCNGTSCQQELRVDKNKPLVLSGHTSTIVGVKITEEYTCKCGNLDPQPRACPEGYENYCLNGGSCNYTSSGGLTCSCLDDLNYGPHCELLTGRFKGGFAWFDSFGTCEEPTLRLTFQSEHPSAVLLYNGPIVTLPHSYYPKDFLYIVLNNWVVEAFLNLGGETSRIYVPVEPSSFEAYDIFLSWTTNTIEMVIPNCGMNTSTESSEACKRTISIPESATSVLNVGGPLQLGGLAPMLPLQVIGESYRWNFDLPSVNPLTGCVSYLEYNGQVYDLNKTSYNKEFFRTCEVQVTQSKIAMSSESVFIIVGSLLVLLLLVLFVLCLLRRRKKPHSYPDHLNEIVKETIGTTDIEGYGEKDMTQFDLKLLRVTNEGKLLNGYGAKGDLPDVAKLHAQKRAPLARLSEGFNVEDFIDDNIQKVDKGHPDFDDVRHYCFEGDEMSIASLSSLGSGSNGDEPPFNYQEDWGPRFSRLAEIYGPKPDEEEDSEYEFPIPKNPPHKGHINPSKLKQITPSSGASSAGSLNTQASADGSEPSTVPYTRLGPHSSIEDERKPPGVVVRGEYHEAVNPLAQSKESWC